MSENQSKWRSAIGIMSLLVAMIASLPAAATAKEDSDDEIANGLISRYQDSSGRSFTRVDDAISFDWQASSPDERLGAPPYSIKSAGQLEVLGAGEYRLGVYATGKCQIKLGGKTIIEHDSGEPAWKFSEPVALSFGFHDLEVDYQSLEGGGRLTMFWSGPDFQWEPIQAQFLYHASPDADLDQFRVGKELVSALRCAACHTADDGITELKSPDLLRLRGNIREDWLVDWIADSGEGHETTSDSSPSRHRRMPFFRMTRQQAMDITTFLLHGQDHERQVGPRRDSAQDNTSQTEKDIAAGRKLFLMLGCLACHQLDGLGQSNVFDGGDLSLIAAKRPKNFLQRWLADPKEINPNHRMPVFDLSKEEQHQLAEFLSTLGKPQTEESPLEVTDANIAEGKKLFAEFKCASCHQKPEARSAISSRANWDTSCISDSDKKSQPRYRLNQSDRMAIRDYYDELSKRPDDAKPRSTVDAQLLFRQHNCFACHQRDLLAGLQETLTAVGKADTELAAALSALKPPSLNSVGDKLHREILTNAIRKPDNQYRPWLLVRMPTFDLPDNDLGAMTDYFVAADHIPELPKEMQVASQIKRDTQSLMAAGTRLVTSAGFGCTSCHQVGKSIPAKAPVNARGPDLSMIGKRMRHAWFERWTRNPARIVPGMEMPSVQIPVKGVLHDDLDAQLASLWQVLNEPGFEPPLPDPVRVVRLSGLQAERQRSIALTDLIRDRERTWIKPFVIGLSNRHNVLFDLETAKLDAWWIGDMANQQNQGKVWFWEVAGQTLFSRSQGKPEFQLLHAAVSPDPAITGQFVTEPDKWISRVDGVELQHRLHFKGRENNGDLILQLRQTFQSIWPTNNEPSNGLQRTIELKSLPKDAQFAMQLFDPARFTNHELDESRRTLTLENVNAKLQLQIVEPDKFEIDENGMFKIKATGSQDSLRIVLNYLTSLPIDAFAQPDTAPEIEKRPPEVLHVVPGFKSIRLPITNQLMPSGICWRPDGKLVVCSLKGRVWLLEDTDRDGVEDDARPISNELSSPYGISAADKYVDVLNKFGLVRLTDEDGDGFLETSELVASGWGHTDDYHDWAIGLPKLDDGGYFVGLPCQQDDRSTAGARYRGTVLRLVPREPTDDDPRLFEIQVVSAGHRFPMGLALNAENELFVTDNQGNYNPFNELNHVTNGAHFGFINKLEQKANASVPALTLPAIDIPHPWTRSVNGICFLVAPHAQADSAAASFGMFAGHLIGCEYDTQRLIRMSLQKVDGTFQGAAYPFSYAKPPSRESLLGPIVCAVSPRGDLYLGSIRDSGWGAGDNVGELVRLHAKLDELPAGIAEVRAVPDGFEVRFTKPIDKELAADQGNYLVSSYTRISSPQYGAPNVDRRVEKVQSVELLDSERVLIKLDQLRENFVYEFRLKDLVTGSTFFPAEAYFTLRKRPKN